MNYKIPADLLQAIIQLIEQMPAKNCFQVLKAIDQIVASTQSPQPRGEER